VIFVAVVATGLCPSAVTANEGVPVEDPLRMPRVVGEELEGPRLPMRRVLYLNFDGVDLQWCGPDEDDPHGNCSTVFQGAVLPYRGGAAERAAVVQTVAADLADFDVVLTTERPPEEIDYDMEMIGQWSPGGVSGFLGIAPKIDCFDGDGGDVSFTLDPMSLTPADTAKVVLQELAHTWGLEHVDSTGDLLFPSVGNAPDPRFEDMCSPITYEPDNCPRQHALHCEDGHQNSYLEMLDLFGPRQPDDVAPTLTIVSPSDGAHVPNDFSLVIELHDDTSPQVFATSIEFVDGFTSDAEFAGPGVFPVALTAVADGEWTVRVTAMDPAGNESTQEIALTVGKGEAPTVDETDTGMPSDESTGDVGESSSGGDEESTGAGPPSSGDDGCGCRAPARGGPFALLFVALACARRRRACARGAAAVSSPLPCDSASAVTRWASSPEPQIRASSIS
jgi:hypothetical protein